MIEWTTLARNGVEVEMVEAQPSTLDLADVERAIEKLSWESASGEKPMSPALGISAVIGEFGLRGVSRIAIGNELAPYGLYGIEFFRQGRKRLYVLDRGHDLVPLGIEDYPLRVAT